MRILFLGDVVGRAARQTICNVLPQIKDENELDFVFINGENSAAGFGITYEIYQELINAGADAITLGNHSFDQSRLVDHIDDASFLVRPANYPPMAPGKGSCICVNDKGQQVLVINLMGRVFMNQLDDPFAVIDRELGGQGLKEQFDAVIIDFHAEATSEKQAFGYFLDSRVSLVVGTHTHTPTADHRILEGGTGYISDLGMCGCYDSVLGMRKEESIHRFVTRVSSGRFEPAVGPTSLCGVAVEISDQTGLAERIEPIRIGPHLAPHWPSFFPGTMINI